MVHILDRKLVATDPRRHCLSQETPLFEVLELRQTRHYKTYIFITTSYVLLSCMSCWVERHCTREVYQIPVWGDTRGIQATPRNTTPGGTVVRCG
jgi:hypothetical protein